MANILDDQAISIYYLIVVPILSELHPDSLLQQFYEVVSSYASS